MADKRIDTRDIFEKALDNAPAIGTTAGFILGAAGGRALSKKMRNLPELHKNGMALGSLIGSSTGAVGGAVIADTRHPGKYNRRNKK